MSLFGNVDQSNNAPTWKHLESTSNALAANLYANTTVSGVVNLQVVGIYGADDSETTGGVAAPGWIKVIKGTGGVTAFTVTAAGSAYGNGETVTVSNGAANATGVIATNATGNVVSVAVSNPGAGWVNSTMTSIAFNGEKHMLNVTVSAGGSGYANTDVVVSSNGLVNGQHTVTTNTTGGITAVTVGSNTGLWGNTAGNTTVVFTILNANGVNSAGTSATLAANIGKGSSATLTVTLGGRAGRKHYETLVAISSMSGSGSTLP